MGFNTGGREPNDRPLFGGEAGRSTRGSTGDSEPGPAGSSGGDFNLQDPVGSFISTARGVLLNPRGFFRNIARQGDFVSPTIFALICALISTLLLGIFTFVVAALFGGPGVEETLAGGVLGLVFSLLLIPIFTAVGLLVTAGILHLLVLLFVRPANTGFEATFRVVSYSQALQLVIWLAPIPILGLIVILLVIVYNLYISLVGIREVHSTTTGKAALVVLIPAIIALLIVLLIFAAILIPFFLSTR